MSTLSVNNEGVNLIERWSRAVKRLEQAKGEVTSATCDLANATNELGKWMVPDSDKAPYPIGEPFNIWIGNGLLMVTQTAQHDFQVQWRKRPTGEGASGLC